jgi:acetyl-CoA decarbonylase/synthase complex subunit delta
VHRNSHGTVSCYTAYSLMDQPMTSCGCFEAIIGYVPECNGVMIVNREFPGDTPIGMPFSSLAGSVGGGVQTPGFMGVGKAFLSSRKLLAADGGYPRVVWMTKELKEMVGEDFAKRAAEAGYPDLLDKIVDESIATEPYEIRRHLEKVGHPVIDLPDMASIWSAPEESSATSQETTDVVAAPPPSDAASPPAVASAGELAPIEPSEEATSAVIVDKAALLAELKAELKEQITREDVAELIGTLQDRFLGGRTEAPREIEDTPRGVEAKRAVEEPAAPARYAAEKLADVTAFAIPKDKPVETIELITLGATKASGGTRGRTVTVGGQNCLPFHTFEGAVPHAPALAIEVFDKVSDRISPALREAWGDLLDRPADMARKAVNEHGADAISVRLEGTHPEKGNRSPGESLALVKDVLAAVDVPLIITAHNHFESANEVMKKVASGCAGERLLLNWVEADNYRTIAGVALAYDHCVVAQTPIDVNLAKQLNILLTNMDLPRDRIMMDPLVGALGYGLEYTYSVMERIRLTGLAGDIALVFPMLVRVGQEAWKAKEAAAPKSAFPMWGDLARRAVMWEVQTAMPLVLAGADLVVLYHPESLAAIRRNVNRLAAHSRP